MITAEKFYKEILEMPLKEREKLFTIREASEYLEVAEITVRRWAKDSILKSKRIGKNIVFDADELKEF
ncbi:MAG: helix-turn-helix domain-containing protein [Nitrospirae bacterium]|nr:helix-turn-helix domain-containing protein [Nitrospirota bacterium]